MFTPLACPVERQNGEPCNTGIGIMTDTGKLIIRHRHHGEQHEVVYAFDGVVSLPRVMCGRMKPQH